MVRKSLFAIRLLEKIGAPLVAAIESAPPEGENSDVAAAEIMAKMLGQAVKMSITLSSTMAVEETEEQADSTRLSLAAIATPLLAGYYRQYKRAPEDADITRMTQSLEAVIGFADKFTPAAEGQSRLSTIDQEVAFFDETQSVLVAMQALTPVVLAINEFSFGQSESKLLQDVNARLESEAQKLSGDEKNKLGQILVLKSLADIYAAAHRKEVLAMSAKGNDSNAAPSLDPVWASFEKQVAMMQALTAHQASSSGSGAGGGTAPVVPTQSEPAQPEAPAQAPVTPPPVPPVTPPPTEAPPAQASAPASGGSPMGFFKKGDDAATPATPETPPAAQAAPTETTQAAQAPATPPPAAPPAEEPGDAASANPGNPMGFFKPGAKKAEDDSS
ncbi:MAG: hypothetical protein AAF549_00515 [Pseudomonadota bacterium]